MAEASTNGLKRPHPDEDQQNAQKKSRSNNGSPLPLTNGSVPTARPDLTKAIAEARARAAAAAARLQGTASPAAQSPSPAPAGSTMDRIAQMKARVAAATQKANATTQQRNAPSTSGLFQPPGLDDGFPRVRGGLDVGLHPALMGDTGNDAKSSRGRQAIQPKFATTMANRRAESPSNQVSKPAKGKKQLDLSGPSLEETRSNPYFDASLGAKTATMKSRKPKQLVFNQKGKFILQAAALRRQAALETMKKRIAESSRKVGIDEDLDTEKGFLVEKPPDIEWWDEGLVKDQNYDLIESSSGLKLDTSDSIVTVYIQHPVALEPPSQQLLTVQKPLPLTSREAAKVRRQRRMENLKEEQAKIRLGLVPAPPPKVKLGNLMRVLGEEAVRDPTKVEAQVREQVAGREKTHLDMNEERKLTKEQAHAKLATQQAQDVAKGVHICVYRIDNLSNGRHRFKINKNAEQQSLVGLCLISPNFSLVIVEGGVHSIAAYKKLMMNRIDWTENSAPNATVREGNKEALASWLRAEDESGQLRDLTANRCQLVFEGEEKTKGFRRWGSRVVETDKEAMDVLRKAKMENFWVQAKGMA
jgi:U4/U6 small nuclear ribonucleoprotein PRP3